MAGKLLIQQCKKAKLQTKFSSEGNEAEYAEIGRGIILYVCFLSEASEDTVMKMVTTALNVKLCETDDRGKVSVLDLPGDILIIPQACLGGKLKGKVFQYHNIVAKNQGQHLYKLFVENCEGTVKENEFAKDKVIVRHGTYGNKQVVNVETNGPFTHIIDI